MQGLRIRSKTARGGVQSVQGALSPLPLASLAVAIGACGAVRAETLTVALDGSGDYSEIQPAIDAALAGDTVVVDPGEYVISIPLTLLGKAISVRAEAGAQVTTIRMAEEPADPDRGSVVIFDSGETAASRLEGFTLTGGTGSSHQPIEEHQGGAVLCVNASSPVLAGCVIAGNSSIYGGGLYIAEGSAPALADCAISGNWAGLGAGLYCKDSRVTITNCTITENGGRTIDTFQWAIDGGGALYDESSATMTNCTIAGNSAKVHGGLLLFPNASVTLTNSIVWNNAGSRGLGIGEISASYSDIESEEVWPGEGNIRLDPLFCSPGDFRLRPGSPCLGTGLDGAQMGATLELCPETAVLFRRGDANADGAGNLTDAVFVLEHLFRGGTEPPCAKSADIDDSGTVDLTDPVFLLNALFAGGPPPAPPFAECGSDPTIDELTCESFAKCQ